MLKIDWLKAFEKKIKRVIITEEEIKVMYHALYKLLSQV